MRTISLATRRPFNWRVFLFLFVLIVLASYAIFPYVSTLTSSISTLPAILINGLIGALQTGAFAAIGLFFAARIGLGLPFVEAWVKREPIPSRGGRALLLAALVGLVAGFVIIVLDTFVFGPPLAAELNRLGIGLPVTIEPPAWQGLLASFSAGVNEEVVFRLLGVTLLAWLGSLISRDSEGRPKSVVFWIAVIVVAVAFGLAHLPTMSAIGIPIDALVVARSIVLNGIGGIVFGWLYWRRGLESAMVGHFSADLVLHVLLVLALRGW
jgi:membrane protease YdiL (CAAX protease family)